MKILKSQLKKLIKESTEEQVPRLNKVDGYFRCENNNLTSLQGAPKYVGGSFYCNDNKLTSLQYAPKYVGGDFWCNNNKKKFTEEEVRAVCNVKGNIYV